MEWGAGRGLLCLVTLVDVTFVELRCLKQKLTIDEASVLISVKCLCLHSVG